MKNTACSFFYTDDRFDSLAYLAITSFKHFHPDVDIFIFNRNNIDVELAKKYTAGYAKFYYAKSLFEKGYEKVISLGVDTITCNKLEEFIENDEDVLLTLDFKYKLEINGIEVPEDKHVNADVVCFNNKQFIKNLLELMLLFPNDYLEQGTLNQMISCCNDKFSYKIIDLPDSDVVYNCRVFEGLDGKLFHKLYPFKFKVENKKLFSDKNKIIKILHLVRGFGKMNKQQFLDEINLYKEKFFNEETKQYFIERCGIDKIWFETPLKESDLNDEDFVIDKKTKIGFPAGDELKYIPRDRNIINDFKRLIKL